MVARQATFEKLIFTQEKIEFFDVGFSVLSFFLVRG